MREARVVKPRTLRLINPCVNSLHVNYRHVKGGPGARASTTSQPLRSGRGGTARYDASTGLGSSVSSRSAVSEAGRINRLAAIDAPRIAATTANIAAIGTL